MNEIKHTPLPWVVTTDGAIFPASSNDLLADTFPMLEGGQIANAEFIVRACNAHYGMLAMLKDILATEDLWIKSREKAKFDRIRAAIAQATLSQTTNTNKGN